LRVEAAREPKDTAVGGDVAHVGAASSGNVPCADELARTERDHGDAAGVAVGDVQGFSVSRNDEPVRPRPGPDETDHLEAHRVDLPHTSGCQVGDVEDLRVRRRPHVLWYCEAAGQLSDTQDPDPAD